MAEDVLHHLLSEVRCNGVPKLIHRHHILINLEGQVHAAEARDGGGGGGVRGRNEREGAIASQTCS